MPRSLLLTPYTSCTWSRFRSFGREPVVGDGKRQGEYGRRGPPIVQGESFGDALPGGCPWSCCPQVVIPAVTEAFQCTSRHCQSCQ
jgi:hypothetical protein